MTREMDEIEREIAQWPRWKLWLYTSRLPFWVYVGLGVLHHKVYGLYEKLMICCWPYDRYPQEWRSLFRRENKP